MGLSNKVFVLTQRLQLTNRVCTLIFYLIFLYNKKNRCIKFRYIGLIDFENLRENLSLAEYIVWFIHEKFQTSVRKVLCKLRYYALILGHLVLFINHLRNIGNIVPLCFFLLNWFQNKWNRFYWIVYNIVCKFEWNCLSNLSWLIVNV